MRLRSAVPAIRSAASAAALVAVAFALAACAYRPTDNPVARSLGWYSYLDAEDIRANCQRGAPTRARLVYNGFYDEQVLAYDLEPEAGGAGTRLTIREKGQGDLTQILLRHPGDLLAPWRGRTDTVILRPEDRHRLLAALQASGVFAPAPAGLQLDSTDFYWIVAACVDGRFAYHAFRWPSAAFQGLAFPPLLAAWDPAGRPFNPPRAIDARIHYGEERAANLRTFRVAVGEQGLIGVAGLGGP